MFKYIYSSGDLQCHELNFSRINFTPKTITQQDIVLNSDIKELTSCMLVSDVLLLNNTLSDIVVNSNCDIELYITSDYIDNHWILESLSNIGVTPTEISGNIYACFLSKRYFNKITSGIRGGITIRVNEINTIACNAKSLDITSFALTTKSRTLAFFNGLISATIDPGISITYSDWLTDCDNLCNTVMRLKESTIIVRSSAISEDTNYCSNAGAYTTVMDVDGREINSVKKAIQAVFDSYDTTNANNQVLVQKQIQEVMMSGVCSSRMIGKNAPYYVINYDDSTGRTDTVTSGMTNSLKTLYVSRFSKHESLELNKNIINLITIIKQIEKISCNSTLDIEFIIDIHGVLNIVQIRTLVGKYSAEFDEQVSQRITASAELFNIHNIAKSIVVSGDMSIFGIMPDANPAELIGIKPRPLAFSLYQRLITDDVVTNQRHEYGYNDVRPVKHMIKLAGSPYVDVRSSFNSFTPASIDPDLRRKLTNLYLHRLTSHRHLHDKVEFDIVVSTWFPGINAWLKEHYADKLDQTELDQISNSSAGIFISAVNRVSHDLQAVESNTDHFSNIENSSYGSLYKCYLMLETCYNHGCKPFAHLARSAFVAVSVLKGFINLGILSSDEYNAYLNSIKSVSTQMERDAFSVKQNNMTKQIFYSKYGHLRPGTYDICSKAYFEDPDKYLDPVILRAKEVTKQSFSLSPETINRINKCFHDNGIDLSFDKFDIFARTAIHGREFGKFSYTKYLSYGLNYFITWGNENGISRDELSYLTIYDIHDFISGNNGLNLTDIKLLIKQRMKAHHLDSLIELPDLITRTSDFHFFYKDPGQPNYITSQSIERDLVIVTSQMSPDTLDLDGKIALIESADPGFDWLFGRSITGLITKYGGANSHMAIRCAELNIAAAIGVGDIVYNQLLHTPTVQLNCANKSIKYS